MSTIKLYNTKKTNCTMVTMVTTGRLRSVSLYHVEWLCTQHAWFKIILNSICQEVSCPVSTQPTPGEGIWYSKPRDMKQPMKLQSSVNSEVWTSTPITQSCVIFHQSFSTSTSPRIWACITRPFPSWARHYCCRAYTMHNLSKIRPWAMNLIPNKKHPLLNRSM